LPAPWKKDDPSQEIEESDACCLAVSTQDFCPLITNQYGGGRRELAILSRASFSLNPT
jgi:hypothetical protein